MREWFNMIMQKKEVDNMSFYLAFKSCKEVRIFCIWSNCIRLP